MSRPRRMLPVALATALLLCSVLTVAAPRTVVPDFSFSGSSLTEWRELGHARWRAENGEIIGMPTSAGGGWLIFERSFQDVGFAANFRCAPGCNAGSETREMNELAGSEESLQIARVSSHQRLPASGSIS